MNAALHWIALAALGLLSCTMLWAWRRQRHTRNAGIVDLCWTLGVGTTSLALLATGEGWGPRRVLAGLMVGIWSLRLSWHLGQRLRREAEDGRYAQMRRDFDQRFDRWMFIFFQVQAFLAVALALVFWPVAIGRMDSWRAQDFLACALWLLAQVGEAIADRQLDNWRTEPGNRGKTCRNGLWRYSRHPNYFFEWLHWIAYAVLAIGLPWGWFTWLASAVMLVLMLKVTGIPPTERQSLRSRPEDYGRYQRETNAFFPGPPRQVGKSS